MLTLFILTGLDLYSSITTVVRALRAEEFTIVSPASGMYGILATAPEMSHTLSPSLGATSILESSETKHVDCMGLV